ncbi:MAG: hypothetical protein BM561_03700 [Vibrio sp. MedPE-SWchi]|nr:MAG: hypothetical protein BM561_03700 [Vibrio sp. MedPE-SWchi]
MCELGGKAIDFPVPIETLKPVILASLITFARSINKNDKKNSVFIVFDLEFTFLILMLFINRPLMGLKPNNEIVRVTELI